MARSPGVVKLLLDGQQWITGPEAFRTYVQKEILASEPVGTQTTVG